jgi:hypothetical protein
MFQPFGTAPHLHWLSLRLRQRGLLLPADETAPDWLPTGWQGYTADNCWLDLGDDDSSALNLRLLHCQQQQVIAVEICGQWQPQGEQLGFMLLCGSALPLPANASRWLDNMAPIPGAWLHCGPAGSARYTLHVMNAMQYAWKLAWQHLPASATPSAINWEQCMQQQWRWPTSCSPCHCVTCNSKALMPPGMMPRPCATVFPATRTADTLCGQSGTTYRAGNATARYLHTHCSRFSARFSHKASSIAIKKTRQWRVF